jgi:hypothetical protein
MRITPENIKSLKSNEIFVFGSNTAGIHGAGAAKLAHQKFGAFYGQGFGLMYKSFAIPTKDSYINTLSIKQIKIFVDEFIEIAKERIDLLFLVTEIGCGLAGYKPKDIAPLFKEALNIENIYLPINFLTLLNKV